MKLIGGHHRGGRLKIVNCFTTGIYSYSTSFDTATVGNSLYLKEYFSRRNLRWFFGPR